MYNEFMKDCLSRTMSLNDVAIKYGIELEDVLPTYLAYKEKYTQEQVNNIMEEAYYNDATTM